MCPALLVRCAVGGFIFATRQHGACLLVTVGNATTGEPGRDDPAAYRVAGVVRMATRDAQQTKNQWLHEDAVR